MSRKPVPLMVTVAISPSPPPNGSIESGATSDRSYSSNLSGVPEADGSMVIPFCITSTS